MSGKKITIFTDTRQKEREWRDIHDKFINDGFNVAAIKLDVGDYMSDKSDNVSVDTKFSIVELAQNVCSKDHKRFRKEIKRANQSCVSLVFLVVDEYVKNLNDLSKWKSKFTSVKGSVLAKACSTIEKRYGVKFEFVKRKNAGKRILELLGVI